MREVVPASLSESESHDQERQNDQDLQRSQHILNSRRAPDSQAVDDGEKRDDRAGQNLGAAQLQFPGARSDDVPGAVQSQRGGEMSQIIGKCQRGGGDGRGESGKERDPTGHESPGGPEGLREINVLAAGAGKVDA